MIGGAGERRVLAIVARFLLCGGGQLVRRTQLWCRVLWWTLVAGPLLLQVAAQLQQQVFTLNAPQVVDQSGVDDAVRAIDVTQSSWVEQSSIVARSLLCGGQLARRAQLWCRVLWWTMVAGHLVCVEPVFGETQEEHLSEMCWNVVTCRIAEVE